MTTDRIAEYLATVPARYRALVTKTFEAAVSPRQAIKAACLRCSGFQRAEVAECAVSTCPLRMYRPYQSGGAA